MEGIINNQDLGNDYIFLIIASQSYIIENLIIENQFTILFLKCKWSEPLALTCFSEKNKKSVTVIGVTMNACLETHFEPHVLFH